MFDEPLPRDRRNLRRGDLQFIVQRLKVRECIHIGQSFKLVNTHIVRMQAIDSLFPRLRSAPRQVLQQSGRTAAQAQKIKAAVAGRTDDGVVSFQLVQRTCQVANRKQRRIRTESNSGRCIIQPSAQDVLNTSSEFAAFLQPEMFVWGIYRERALRSRS